MYTLISKIVIIHAKKQVEKNKIEADPDSDGGENHACTRQFKKTIALVRCMLFILSCSKFAIIHAKKQVEK